MGLLVVTVLGFIRALQRTYLAAWKLPAQGLRGLGDGVLASTALISEFVLLTLFGPVLTVFLGSLPIRLTVQALCATALWWPVQYLLLGGRIGWRVLLPGAALTGGGQAGAILVSGLYLPMPSATRPNDTGWSVSPLRFCHGLSFSGCCSSSPRCSAPNWRGARSRPTREW
jgi:membrane protein